MRVFVDMDAVICDFVNGLSEMVFWKYGKILNPQEIKHYNLAIDTGISRLEVNSILESPCFFSSLKPIPKAVDYLKILNEDNRLDLWIATQPQTLVSIVEKYNWLKEHLPFFPLNKAIFIPDKNLLKGDVIIDDNPEFLEGFEGVSICFDYPYNRSCKSAYRVNDWEECYKVLQKVIN